MVSSIATCYRIAVPMTGCRVRLPQWVLILPVPPALRQFPLPTQYPSAVLYVYTHIYILHSNMIDPFNILCQCSILVHSHIIIFNMSTGMYSTILYHRRVTVGSHDCTYTH